MRRLWVVVLVMFVSGCLPGPLQTDQGGSAPLGMSTSAVFGSQIRATAPSSTAPVIATSLPTTLATLVVPTIGPSDTALPSPTITATPEPTLPAIIPITVTPQSLEQRWRAQQENREVFSPPIVYTTNGNQPLYWYDPINQQSVLLGFVNGEVLVQARFTLRGLQAPSLEIPYRINQDYGLTALSPSLISRIAAVGYDSNSIESYMIQTPDIQPRP